MRLECTIATDVPAREAEALFGTELARPHERSKTELRDEKGSAVFRITAKDVASLRAATNTITSILAMHEKTKALLDGEDGQSR